MSVALALGLHLGMVALYYTAGTGSVPCSVRTDARALDSGFTAAVFLVRSDDIPSRPINHQDHGERPEFAFEDLKERALALLPLG